MSVKDHDYDEKRNFIRMFINAPVDFAIKDTNDWKTGTGIDLSGGGLAFTSDHSIDAGVQVTIKLQPITSVTPPLEAIVTVIRTDDNEDGLFNISTKIDKILS